MSWLLLLPSEGQVHRAAPWKTPRPWADPQDSHPSGSRHPSLPTLPAYSALGLLSHCDPASVPHVLIFHAEHQIPVRCSGRVDVSPTSLALAVLSGSILTTPCLIGLGRGPAPASGLLV